MSSAIPPNRPTGLGRPREQSPTPANYWQKNYWQKSWPSRINVSERRGLRGHAGETRRPSPTTRRRGSPTYHRERGGTPPKQIFVFISTTTVTTGRLVFTCGRESLEDSPPRQLLHATAFKTQKNNFKPISSSVRPPSGCQVRKLHFLFYYLIT